VRCRLSFTGLALLFVACASLGTASAHLSDHATTLQGIVTDGNGTPIAGAYIAASNEAGDTLVHTRTRSNGSYELVLPPSTQTIWVGKTEGDLFSFIPDTKPARAGTANFRLQPGANIIIDAYDSAGNPADNARFRRLTQSRVFLCDMSGRPATGWFGAITDNATDWSWDRGQPALIVLPGHRYKILVQWEMPHAGKLLFTLDNGGLGYEIDQRGGAIKLNLDREIARSSLAALRREASMAPNPAAMKTAIATSARFLQEGEALMAKPMGTSGANEDFGLSTGSSLTARENIVLTRARANILRYRTGEADVSVMDGNDQPLPSVQIKFRQVDNDFQFGANPLGQTGSYNPRLASLMRQAGFNQSYITARWGLLEPHAGEFNWRNIDSFQDLVDQKAQGFRVSGALSLWLAANNSDFVPGFLAHANVHTLEEAVYRYGQALARRYADRINVWETNELNLKRTTPFHLDWDERIAVGRAFVAGIKDVDPKARIMNGSLALRYDVTDSRPLRELLDADAPTDIIGLELYQAGVNADGFAPVGLDLVSIDQLLDHYETFGKPIIVKEFSAPSVQVDGSSWWHHPWDPEMQAEFARDVYTIAFSKRLVHGMTWAWGVLDSDAFIDHGGLIDNRGQPKPAFIALKELLASWRTHGDRTTDAAGRASWKGFAGDYKIAVIRDGDTLLRTTLHIKEQQRERFVLHVPAAPIIAAAGSLMPEQISSREP
jgi:Carboxypeptidase regulatory-like domain/Glycosyl hydrolase family 10